MKPFFERFDLSEIAARTGYSEEYLAKLKNRPDRIKPRFRSRIAAIFAEPEEVLFPPREHQAEMPGISRAAG